jgi:uncharacterized YigZ family protein
MYSGYAIPAGTHRVAQVIERSRFITTLGAAPGVEAARALIDTVRAEFPDATHNCWAYVAGPPGSSGFIGMSDAGEPHGTAGRPMLDVLLHSGVGDIVAVVTRYYGGVKLGKGGLVRAYGGCVQNALATLPRAQRVTLVDFDVTVGYADVDVLRRVLGETGALPRAEQYAEAVTFRAAVPEAAAADFARLLADRTAGRARLHRVGTEDAGDTGADEPDGPVRG